MKKLIHFAFAAASALLLTACAKTDEQRAPKGHVVTLSASIEEDEETKAIIGDDGSFKWRAYDKISVWTSDGKLTDFNIKGGVNTATATFEANLAEGVDVAGPAIYPARSGHSYNPESNTITYDQPVKYDLNVGETKSQMAAKYDEETKNFVFKHLGGLIRYTIYNPPSEAKRVRLAYDKISGKYSVNMDVDTPQISRDAVTSANSRLDIGFPDGYSYAVGNCLVFDFPVPADTYENLTFQLADNTPTVLDGYNKVIKKKRLLRRDMIRMPEVTFNMVELSHSEDNQVRDNMNKGYDNTEGTQLTVVSNNWKSVTNASQYALKVDASKQDTSSSETYKGGYFLIKTQNSDYTPDFRQRTKAFAVKIRYNNEQDASNYYPQAYCNGATDESTKRLPDRINGVSFDGKKESWASLIKPNDWNILQWTCVNTGTWRVEITPFLTFEGSNAADGSRIMYFDDFRFLK